MHGSCVCWYKHHCNDYIYVYHLNFCPIFTFLWSLYPMPCVVVTFNWSDHFQWIQVLCKSRVSFDVEGLHKQQLCWCPGCYLVSRTSLRYLNLSLATHDTVPVLSPPPVYMEPLLLSAATTVNVTNLGPEVTARKQTCKAMFDVGENNTWRGHLTRSWVG